MDVDWYRLECFRVAGRLEHLSKAAIALRTSQPAVSRAIGKLEEQLGVLLFDRIGRSVKLTEHGRLLLQKMEKAHREVEGAQRLIRESGQADNRPTRVGFMRSLSARVIPRLVRAYRTSHPQAQFSFVTNSGSAIADLLESGELDLILIAAPKERPSLTWKKVFDQRLIAIAPLNSPLEKAGPIGIKELAEQPFVTFKSSHVMRTLIDQIFESAGVVPKVTFEGDDSSSIPGFVAAGLGVAILAHDSEFPKDVVILPTNGPLFVRPVGLAWVNGSFMPEGVRNFRDFVLRNGPSLISKGG